MRMATALVLAVVTSGCVSGTSGALQHSPRSTERPALQIHAIADYDRAIGTIAAIFRSDLGFPAFPVTFHFYPSHDAFEAALLDAGYDAELARNTASTMSAIGGHRRVLLNESTLTPLSWPARVSVLAHEMTHSLQYEWGAGVRGHSDQWLREGFAEWVAVRVLDRLGAVSLNDLRRQRRAELHSARHTQVPKLDEMATFPQWVAVTSRSGAVTYARAFLAVDALIEKHGIAAIVQYFQLFVLSQDRTTNFRLAFGDDLATFESTLRAQLR